MSIEFWQSREEQILKPNLFNEEAEKWAKLVYQAGLDRNGRNLQKNMPSQIRKFFDEVVTHAVKMKTLSSNPEIQKKAFEKQIPFLNMLLPKVKYSEGRNHVTKEFTEFLQNCLRQVQQPNDIAIFKSFFESFIGYYKYLEKFPTTINQNANRSYQGGGKRQ